MQKLTHCPNCTGQLGAGEAVCSYCGTPIVLQPSHPPAEQAIRQVLPISLQPRQLPVLTPPVKQNSLATASLVVSCVGWLFNLLGITPIIAIILGASALKQIKNTGDAGRGSAKAAIIISVINLVFIVLIALFVVYWVLDKAYS